MKRTMFKLITKYRLFIITGFTIFFVGCIIISYYQLGGLSADDTKLVFRTIDDHRAHLRLFRLFSDHSSLRILSYCNPPTLIRPDSEFLHSEFLKTSRLQLTSVVVAIRHGDRGPLRYVNDLDRINCDPYNEDNNGPLHSLLTKDQKRILKKYKDFVSSSPEFPSVQYKYPFPGQKCQLGNLSAIGNLQHLILGRQMSQVYRNHLDLQSVVENKVKIFTTDYSRTVLSAIAFLFGFLEDEKVNSVDHHVFPQIEMTEGTLFCGKGDFCTKCDKVAEILRDIDNSPDSFMKRHPKVKELFYKLRQIIAKDGEETLFSSLEKVYDGLMAYLCHDHHLPCNGQQCATTEDVADLISAFEASWKESASNPLYRKMNFLKIFGFLHQLSQHFDSIMAGQHVKFLLFSGHDVTLVPILSALSVFDGFIPPYASRIVFETYHHRPKTGSVNHFLRIIYNGKDVTGDTEICKTKNCLEMNDSITNRKLVFIHLDYFRTYIDNKFKQITQSSSFQDACK